MNTRTLTSSHLIVNGLTAIVSLIGVWVIIHYILEEIQSGIFNPSQFFLYFTVQTGVLFALMQTTFVYVLNRERAGRAVSWQRTFDIGRFCISLYALMIAPIYWGVVEPPGTWRLDNFWIVIHLLVPIAALISWLVTPSVAKVRYTWPLVALMYPVLFVAISIVRGHLDGWYPYDFLNHTLGGWVTVGAWVAVLSVGVVVIGLIMLATSRRHYQR